MADHLGYERHVVSGRGSGNSRNATSPKTVTTGVGRVDLAVPRDRAGTFAPVTAPQAPAPPRGPVGECGLFVREGLTTGEIGAHLEEVYDASVSRETISEITDEVVADTAVWQNRTPRRGLPGGVDRRYRGQGPRRAGH